MVVQEFANNPLLLGEYSYLLGFWGLCNSKVTISRLLVSFLIATLEFMPISQLPHLAVLAYEVTSLF
jgi:hypothetical protein